MAEKKRKRRFGDRKEGRRLKSLDPYYSFQPFIMKTRTGSSNLFEDSIEMSEADQFLRQMRSEGYKGMGMLHVIVAAYVRTVSQRPAFNRFISGRRVYARNVIEVIMTVKKSMSTKAGETSIKVIFDPHDTIVDVYNKMNVEIQKVKDGEEETSTDTAAAILCKLPRPILKLAMRLIEFLDYYGKLPQALLNASPFHGSLVITDLGSLGIRPVYHHLYDFGNVPVFIAFGAKRKAYELNKEGAVEEKKYIDYRLTLDERICDGFYFAQGFKYFKSYLKRPEQLIQPPETVEEDLER